MTGERKNVFFFVVFFFHFEEEKTKRVSSERKVWRGVWIRNSNIVEGSKGEGA